MSKLRTRIDLNLLAVFDAIYSRKSVTQAARHLNLSQSAISHALARLRREFDDELFVRVSNSLVPTALSRSIVDPVRSALRGVDAAVAAASRFDPSQSNRLFRIGLRQSTEVRVFDELVIQALVAAPGVRLASVNFRRGELARALAYGDLDLAIDVRSDGVAGLHAVPLQSDDLVVALRQEHPRVRGPLNLDAYLNERHVVASPRPAGLGVEDEVLAERGLERQIAARCQHMATAWQIVAKSDLLLTLSESLAHTLTASINLRLLTLPLAIAPRELQLYWHETAANDPGNQWLRNLVENTFRALPQYERR